MRTRLTLNVALTISLACIALLVTRLEEHSHPGFVHHRSVGWVVLSVTGIAVLLLLSRAPSRLLAAACGVLAGGTLGNLLWAAGHALDVSNSFVFQRGDGGVAFNLADVFVLTGILFLMVASMRLAVRHRHVLPRSPVVVRLARRLISRS